MLKKCGITPEGTPELKPWKHFLALREEATEEVRIALVGKYVELQDAYKSIDEALLQAATYNGRKLRLISIHSERITSSNVASLLEGIDGVVVAPGFGARGVDGKFEALRYTREHGIPTLGICLGMQCMVIEFARNVLGWKDAHTTEIDPSTTHKVVDLMEEQKSISELGGSMRLGGYDCILRPGSRIATAYGADFIRERHRHRFEFNSQYREDYERAGMVCAGENPDTGLVETVEIPDHRWYVGGTVPPRGTRVRCSIPALSSWHSSRRLLAIAKRTKASAKTLYSIASEWRGGCDSPLPHSVSNDKWIRIQSLEPYSSVLY